MVGAEFLRGVPVLAGLPDGLLEQLAEEAAEVRVPAGEWLLRGVPVLAGLPDGLLEQLAEEAAEVRVPAGEWLLREGEEADSLYVIRSGRLEVVDEGPPAAVIRMLRRGDVIGELALLQAGVRSASARARRDSELLELSRERFESLIGDVPAFAVGLTRAIGAQLAASRAPAAAGTPPGTVAVLPLDAGAPAREAAAMLVEEMARHREVAELGPGRAEGREGMLAALDAAERDAERVVLVADSERPGDEWTDFCAREADLVLAVGGEGGDSAWLQRPDALSGCDLLLVGAAASVDGLRGLQPREVQVLREPARLRERIGVLARRLCGRSLGVVLSGGGARAFAHLGAVEEMTAAGLRPDRIGGVSLGSVVGAGLALGHEPERLAELFRQGFVETNPTGDYTLPVFSLIRGNRTRELLRAALGGHRIEELERRFFCVSCDLIGREPVVHRTGPVADAVYASLSIPGLFPPVSTADGRLLVDGGVLDNLPVSTMAGGEGPVVAVDVTGRIGGFGEPVRPGVARMGRPVRRFLTGGESELPRLGETVVRTVTVGSIDTAEAARRHADLVIQPEVDGIGLLEWRRLDEVREAGRAAAREALAGWEGAVPA